MKDNTLPGVFGDLPRRERRKQVFYPKIPGGKDAGRFAVFYDHWHAAWRFLILRLQILSENIMDDSVIEVFIKARKNRRTPLYYALIILAALALSAVVYYYFRLIGVFLVLILFAIAFYGIILVKKYNDLEYEVSIVSGEMTISEIRNQTKRKKTATFLLKDVQNFKILSASDVLSKTRGYREDSSKRQLFCFGDDASDGTAKICFFTAGNAADGKAFDVFMDVTDERIMDELIARSFEVRRVLKQF